MTNIYNKLELVMDASSKLSILVEDLNGPHAYTNERAAFGYISPHLRLQVPHRVAASCKPIAIPQTVMKMSDKHLLETMFLNFEMMQGGGVTAEAAIRMAVLRARWIITGNLLVDPSERRTPIDEVDVPPTASSFGLIDSTGKAVFDAAGSLTSNGDSRYDAFVKAFNDCDVENWMKIAPTLWAVVAHVFRVRGHHYKSEYNSLYEKTWRGTTMELPDQHLTWENISRDAIHSFGVLALERSTAFYVQNHVLPNNLVLRRDSVPCGSAVVGTTYAVLMQFQSTPWYAQFYSAYENQVNDLTRDFKALKDAGLSAHISAGLYGLKRAEISTAAAEALAPVMVGFIKASPEESAMKSQRSLDKHASNNPMMTKLIQEWLENRILEAAKSPRLLIQAAPAEE